MNKTILICGSRYASDELLARVRGGVLRVWYRHDALVVGDAAGVDAYAVQLAEKHDVAYRAWGLSATARNGATFYSQMKLPNYPARVLYQWRDEFMVEQADVVLCFWNGSSKGTRHVFDYAKGLNKEAYLIGENGLITGYQPQVQQLEMLL